MIFLIGVVDEHQKPRCTSGKSSISIHKSASIRRVAGWMQTAPHLEFVISSGDRFGKFVIYPSVFASGPLSWPTEGILGAEIRSQKKRALFTKFRIRVANRMHQHPFLQPPVGRAILSSVPRRWFRRTLSGGKVGGEFYWNWSWEKKFWKRYFIKTFALSFEEKNQ